MSCHLDETGIKGFDSLLFFIRFYLCFSFYDRIQSREGASSSLVNLIKLEAVSKEDSSRESKIKTLVSNDRIRKTVKWRRMSREDTGGNFIQKMESKLKITDEKIEENEKQEEEQRRRKMYY